MLSVFVFKFEMVPGYSMPRNHKDKYENNSNRRSYTIMSPEEAAAGKKTYWTELEITGRLRISDIIVQYSII